MRPRGTTNRNDRGSTESRRRRKAWIIDTFGVGGIVTCYLCAVPLDEDTLTIDRIIPGCEGGRYVRGNIRPACPICNSSTGGQLGAARRKDQHDTFVFAATR